MIHTKAYSPFGFYRIACMTNFEKSYFLLATRIFNSFSDRINFHFNWTQKIIRRTTSEFFNSRHLQSGLRRYLFHVFSISYIILSNFHFNQIFKDLQLFNSRQIFLKLHSFSQQVVRTRIMMLEYWFSPKISQDCLEDGILISWYSRKYIYGQ